MKTFLISIFNVFLLSCSVTESRKPSSVHISTYEQDGMHFIELDLLLTKSRSRVDIPHFEIKSINYTEAKLNLDIFHNEEITCYDGLRGSEITSCALNNSRTSIVKLVYSFDKIKPFPVHEASWKEKVVKDQFTYSDILKSKILKKINNKRGLFLSEKIFLLKEFSEIEKVVLNFPRKKNFRYDTTLPDLVVLNDINSNLSHKDLGEVPLSGLMKSDFVDDRFHEKKINPFEFYCKSKKKIFGLDQDVILIEHLGLKDKVSCSFNNKVKKIFGRVKVKGQVNFSIRSLYLDQTVEKLKDNEHLMESKLKEITSGIDKENVNIIYNGLIELQSPQ